MTRVGEKLSTVSCSYAERMGSNPSEEKMHQILKRDTCVPVFSYQNVIMGPQQNYENLYRILFYV